MCNLRSNIQVHSRDKKKSTGTNQSSNITQAFFCIWWIHMAKEPVCHHYVLRPQNIDYVRISCIPWMPGDSFHDPRPNVELMPFPIKHQTHFFLGDSFKNLCAKKFSGFQGVNSFLGELQKLL